MKRFALFLALVLLVAMPTFAERVTSETARKVATTFLNNNGAKVSQLTDLSKEAGFPNLYIFTAEQGFVVMAADNRVQPILGYSLTGNFSAKDMPENVRDWLQGYNDEIQYVLGHNSTSSPETAQLWKDLRNGKSNAATTTVIVDALVETQWNQNGSWYCDPVTYLPVYVDLYNNLCPYDNTAGELTVTGCVATAMAQVMKYWNFPSHGIGSHSYIPSNRPEFGEQFADFGATTYEWSNMPNTLDINSTEVQKNAIATLMYHCGVAVEMMYDIASNGGSGASSYDIPYALYNYFGYKTSTYLTKNSYSDSEWISMLKTELNADRPVQYNGRGTGGHAFVCDGYDSNNYFHFNWGWAGANDGFYSLTSLAPGSGGAGGSNYNFTNNQSAVFGIQPTSNNAIPTNLTYTLSGTQDITLNWTGARGATSYNIYCNDNLISNTTANTYSGTAPFGTDVYYVRSVNSAGDLSLPSNLITVTITYQLPVVDDLTATISNNNVTLSWTAPEWCYPETPSATLAYGTQTNSGTYFPWGTNSRYWGHRHLAENISAYNGLRLYDVDFYVNDPGIYELCIFEGTTTSNYGYTVPLNQVYSQSVSALNSGWNTINLNNPYFINGAQDLWVFIHNPEAFDNLQVYLCQAEGNEGVYYSANPTSYIYNNATGYAFLIKAFLTDGTYTYNLYRNDALIAQNVNSTTYNTQLASNNANLFCVKTNYYGGVTESNKIGVVKGNASLPNLNLSDIDVMTISSGNKLTVNGTLTNNDPASLIIEDGGQLVHSSANVKATAIKTIAPYTTNQNDGWQLIGSPVTESFTPSADNGLLDGSYDLYYYDEPTFCWMNYRYEPFNLVHKKGYLYANGQTGGTSIQFAGTLQPSNASVTVSNLSHSAAHLNGFNLVANPFVCNATVNRDFYVMNDEGSEIELAANGRQIAPCEGIFIVATNANASVTFTKSNAKKSEDSNFDITIAQGGRNLDRARVRFDKAEPIAKFNLKETSTKLYFSSEGKDWAVVCTNGDSEMPLNFKASRNGTYTLGIEAESLDLNYLHLFDNLTGADIDLLSTPSYTFETKTSDYASRFRLVFASNDTDANDNFVYVANGQLHIFEQGEAELQIIDVTGRVLICKDAANASPIAGMTPGVYIVRLINGNEVKTQKVVIQ